MGNKRGSEEHREKRKKCYKIYNSAISTKKLLRSFICENCLSTESIHGHHVDYDEPLNVVWLCKECHYKIHVVNSFMQRNEFTKRTSTEISESAKKTLYEKLNLNKFRKISSYEQSSPEEENRDLKNFKIFLRNDENRTEHRKDANFI